MARSCQWTLGPPKVIAVFVLGLSWRCQAGKGPLNTRQGKAPKVDATAWNSSLATDKNSGSPVLSPVCVKGQSSPECYQPLSHGLWHLRRAPDGTRDHRCPMPPLPVFSSPPSAHSRRWFSLFITGLGSNSWPVCVKHVFSPT